MWKQLHQLYFLITCESGSYLVRRPCRSLERVPSSWGRANTGKSAQMYQPLAEACKLSVSTTEALMWQRMILLPWTLASDYSRKLLRCLPFYLCSSTFGGSQNCNGPFYRKAQKHHGMPSMTGTQDRETRQHTRSLQSPDQTQERQQTCPTHGPNVSPTSSLPCVRKS